MTPGNSCSRPIGSSTATHFGESRAWSASSVGKEWARSRSSRLTRISRARPSSSQRFQRRSVPTSTPMTPETHTMAPSTTRSAPRTSAWKLGSPGVSMRLIVRPSHSRWVTDAEIDIPRRRSSSSWSETVVFSVTLPSLFTVPVSNSRASTSEVLPVPRWPITATFRIFPGSVPGMHGLPAESDGCPGGYRARGRTIYRNRLAEPLGGRALEVALELGLEAQDRLGVKLRDARLRDPEHLADLAQGELVVVVERDDRLLAVGQLAD